MYGFNQHATENNQIMLYFTRESLSKNREDVAKLESKNEISSVENPGPRFVCKMEKVCVKKYHYTASLILVLTK